MSSTEIDSKRKKPVSIDIDKVLAPVMEEELQKIKPLKRRIIEDIIKTKKIAIAREGKTKQYAQQAFKSFLNEIWVKAEDARAILLAVIDKKKEDEPLYEEGMPFEDAVSLVNRDAALTHDNNVIRITNCFCLDIAVNGMRVLEKPEYQALLSTLRQGHSAWVIYTLHDVLEVLKMDLSILNGFKELVSRGGDTDTNCAIYGAVRGYKKSFELSLDDYLDRALQKILQVL